MPPDDNPFINPIGSAIEATPGIEFFDVRKDRDGNPIYCLPTAIAPECFQNFLPTKLLYITGSSVCVNFLCMDESNLLILATNGALYMLCLADYSLSPPIPTLNSQYTAMYRLNNKEFILLTDENMVHYGTIMSFGRVSWIEKRLNTGALSINGIFARGGYLCAYTIADVFVIGRDSSESITVKPIYTPVDMIPWGIFASEKYTAVFAGRIVRSSYAEVSMFIFNGSMSKIIGKIDFEKNTRVVSVLFIKNDQMIVALDNGKGNLNLYLYELMSLTLAPKQIASVYNFSDRDDSGLSMCIHDHKLVVLCGSKITYWDIYNCKQIVDSESNRYLKQFRFEKLNVTADGRFITLCNKSPYGGCQLLISGAENCLSASARDIFDGGAGAAAADTF